MALLSDLDPEGLTSAPGQRRYRRSNTAPTTELGAVTSFVGLPGWASYVEEQEQVPELVWPNSTFMYHRMRSDTQLDALFRAATWPVRRYKWFVDPNGADEGRSRVLADQLSLPLKGEERKTRPRLKGRFSFDDHMRQAFLALWYGHYPFEQVGTIVNDLWKLRKLAPRPPHTISEITVAKDGGLLFFKQDLTDTKPIPVDRCLWYVWDKEGANWAGRSLMRSCYQPWLLKDRLLRVDAIRHERNGMGVPIIEMDKDAKFTGPQMNSLQALAESYKIAESNGGALPPGAHLRLVGVEGAVSDVLQSIRYHDEAMARALLLMFMQLGQTRTGSRALGDSFIDWFDLGQEVIADWFVDMFCEFMIEDYWDWNYGEDEDDVPRLAYDKDTDPEMSLEQMALMVDKQIIIADDELETFLRDHYKLPEKSSKGAAPDRDAVPVGPGESGGGTPSSAPGSPSPGAGATKPQSSAVPKSNVKASAGKENMEDIPVYDGLVMAKTAERQKIKLVTRPRVPIMRVGDYHLLSGDTKFEEADLVSAVAAQHDPAVKNPRLGVGHMSTFGDGAPAFGRYENLYYDPEDQTLYGDMTGIAEPIDDILDVAYPNRSIEGRWGVETSTGQKHRFVITGVKLLGVEMPGIDSLEDLPDLYNGSKTPVITDNLAPADSDDTVAVYASGAPVKPRKVLASASIDNIRKAFNEKYGYAKWICEIYVEPQEVICEDSSEEKLYRVAYSISGDTIEFGDETEVVIQYEDVAVAARASVTFASADQYRAADNDKKENHVDPKELRKKLGLPEDANDEAVTTALIAKANLTAELPANEPTVPKTDKPDDRPAGDPNKGINSPADADEKDGKKDEGGTSVAKPETVTLDKATFEKMMQTVGTVDTLVAEKTDSEVDKLVTASVRAGKIPPARADHWKAYLKSDFEGGKEVLASMAAVLPVSESSELGGGGDEALASQDDENYHDALLTPAERARKKAYLESGGDEPGSIMTEHQKVR